MRLYLRTTVMTQPAIIRVKARLMMPTSKTSKWKICHDPGTTTEYRQAMVIPASDVVWPLARKLVRRAGDFSRGANISSEDCQNRCDITKRNVSASGVPCADEHRRVRNAIANLVVKFAYFRSTS